MPVTALLELRLLPDAVAGAQAVLHDTLAATRAFDGCLDVEVLVDTADEAHVVVVEHWASVEADAAYRAWRATPDGASALRDLVAAPPVLTVLTTAEGV